MENNVVIKNGVGTMSAAELVSIKQQIEVPEIEMADASEVDKTTISFWHSMGGVNGQAIDTLVQKFNDENDHRRCVPLWALDNNDPKKLRATWEFVKFLISPESQAFWNAETGYFPVNVDAHDEDVFKENIEKYPQFETAIDQLHDSAPQYAGALLSVFSEARAIVESEIESMLNGNETVDEAVDSMASQINDAIEEYNLVNN